MKHFATRAFAAVVLSNLALVVPLNVQAEPSCSHASLSGGFGYTNNGTILGGPDDGPFGGVGRQTFDGKGNTEATAAVSVNGNIAHATINGTYAVNSNCTGSMTLVGSAGSQTFTNHVEFVIVHRGTEFRAINTDPGSVITTVGKKQSE